MEAIQLATWGFWGFRLVWALYMAGSGSAVALVWACSECLQAYSGLRNLLEAKSWASSWHSWGVLCAYALSYLFVPVYSNGPFALLVASGLLCTLVLRGYLALYLGPAYSSGAINYHSLVTSGPWSLCRHPLAALSMLSRCLYVLGSFSLWNIVVLLWSIAVSWYTAIGEERYLSEVDLSYNAYMTRTPYRFLPLGGVK